MEESNVERNKQIQEFACFTGTTDEDKAVKYLEASNWDVPAAVQLFYAEQTAVGDSQDEPRTSHQNEEEQVRAPLPTKFERLVDKSAQYEQLYQRNSRQMPIYEAFRDHSAELAEYEHGPDAEGGTTGLAKLYKAPIEILFRGGFEDAKETAAAQNSWLMVNIQSAAEFASHQLNCDTFSNDFLQEMIKAKFILLQTYNDGNTGRKLMHYYHIEQFPCVLVIDPVTGELMQQFNGFVSAERLTEVLVEYMDYGPNDGNAGQLLKRHHRGVGNAADETSFEHNYDEAAALDSEQQKADENDASQGYSSDMDIECEPPSESSKQLENDERALADMVREPALSPAPAAPEADTCTVAFLLPDGQRLQRLFHKNDTVENLYGYCNSEVEEAKTRRYKLKNRIPGSQPLTDFVVTLEDAGVEDARVLLIWDD